MNDTSPQMAAKMEEMFGKRTPCERLGMGCSMFDLAKQLVRSSIMQKSPGLSSAELRKDLFLRIYGNDFDGIRREEIIKYLERTPMKSSQGSKG